MFFLIRGDQSCEHKIVEVELRRQIQIKTPATSRCDMVTQNAVSRLMHFNYISLVNHIRCLLRGPESSETCCRNLLQHCVVTTAHGGDRVVSGLLKADQHSPLY